MAEPKECIEEHEAVAEPVVIVTEQAFACNLEEAWREIQIERNK